MRVWYPYHTWRDMPLALFLKLLTQENRLFYCIFNNVMLHYEFSNFNTTALFSNSTRKALCGRVKYNAFYKKRKVTYRQKQHTIEWQLVATFYLDSTMAVLDLNSR